MNVPYSAQAELAEAVATLGGLEPESPLFTAHLVLALRALARRVDELEDRLGELVTELGG